MGNFMSWITGIENAGYKTVQSIQPDIKNLNTNIDEAKNVFEKFLVTADSDLKLFLNKLDYYFNQIDQKSVSLLATLDTMTSSYIERIFLFFQLVLVFLSVYGISLCILRENLKSNSKKLSTIDNIIHMKPFAIISSCILIIFILARKFSNGIDVSVSIELSMLFLILIEFIFVVIFFDYIIGLIEKKCKRKNDFPIKFQNGHDEDSSSNRVDRNEQLTEIVSGTQKTEEDTDVLRKKEISGRIKHSCAIDTLVILISFVVVLVLNILTAKVFQSSTIDADKLNNLCLNETTNADKIDNFFESRPPCSSPLGIERYNMCHAFMGNSITAYATILACKESDETNKFFLPMIRNTTELEMVVSLANDYNLKKLWVKKSLKLIVYFIFTMCKIFLLK